MGTGSKYSFCLLILGDLGEAGQTSLKSILNLNPQRICVVADSIGEAWLLSNIEVKSKDFICLHIDKLIQDKIRSLDLFELSDYASFGHAKFFQLMILKWLLLIDVMNNHEIEFALYSDLDVFWNKLPNETIDELLSSNFLGAIQDDFNSRTGRNFLCPGIMFWKNNINAKEMISSIYEFQKSEIGMNPNYTDDKALNHWLTEHDKYSEIMNLSRSQFVIGHRFIDLMFGRKNFKMGNLIAFHANYVTGIKFKNYLLR